LEAVSQPNGPAPFILKFLFEALIESPIIFNVFYQMEVFGKSACKNEKVADFPSGLTHAILVCAINEERMKKEFMPYKMFKSALVDRLSKDLPSIGLVSFSLGGDPLSLFSDYVS
jgi:hypothetical protein